MPKPKERRPLLELICLPLVFILIVALSQSCEKDDICVDGDTPLLGVAFLDNADSLTEKSVPALRIISIGQSEPPDTFSDRSSQSSVSIPLNVSRDTTEYLFIRNSQGSNNTESGNIDTLLLIYRVTPIYVSRACGFIAEFDSLDVVIRPDSNPWILGAEFTATRLSNNETLPLFNVYH